MKVKSQLIDAQLEHRGSPPTKKGEILIAGTAVQVHDGSQAQTIATIGSAQTFTNKTLTAPAINGAIIDGSSITTQLQFNDNCFAEFRETTANGTSGVQVKAPASLAASVDFVLPGTEGNAGEFLSTDGSGETSWGAVAGGSGTKNFIDSVSAELTAGVGSWETDDGAGSAASYLTISQETSAPLAGTGSLKVAKSANDASGEFIKVTTDAIDITDRGKTLYGSFSYDTTHASYASGDFVLEIYDNTNAAVLYAGTSEDLEILNSSGRFNFAVSLTATTASIEVRLKVNSTSASAYDLYFDEFKLGPSAQVTTLYRNAQTLVLDGSGAITTGTVYINRVGDLVTIHSDSVIAHSSASSVASAVGAIPEWARPAISVNNVSKFGASRIVESSVATTGTLQSSYRDYAGSTTNSTGEFFNISFIADPISGGVVSNNELSLKTIRAKGADNGGTALTANVTNIDWTETSDSHSCWNGSQFTSPKTQEYSFEGFVYTSASVAITIYAHIDGTQSVVAGYDATAGVVHAVNWSGVLQKDEILSFRSNGAATLLSSTVFHWMTIKSAPDYTVLGASKNRNKIQTKTLSTSKQSDGTMSDLTFSNLVTGRFYEIRADWSFVLDAGAADTAVAVKAVHNSVTINSKRITLNESSDSASDVINATMNFVFQAESSTITFDISSATIRSYIFGDGTLEYTNTTIEERNDLVETSEF